jgi:hypothetical protein
MALEQELESYRKELPGLLTEKRGQFVLIKGDRLLGVFPSKTDALAAGYSQLGHVAFLVKQVQEHEPVLAVVSYPIVPCPG